MEPESKLVREQKQEKEPEKDALALFFYNDHHPNHFLRFQDKYLDNIFFKFLLRQGFIHNIVEWKEKGTLIPDKEPFGDYASEHEFWHKNNDLPEPANVSQEERKGHLRRLEKLFGKLQPNLDKADLTTYNLSNYRKQVWAFATWFCQQGGATLHDAYKGKYLFDYSQTSGPVPYEILVVGRFGGSICIKSKIGSQTVFFCYGDSKRGEIPCTSEEVFRGKRNWKDEKLDPKWRASRVAVLDEDLYADVKKHVDHHATRQLNDNKLRAAWQTVQHCQKSNAFLSSLEDLASVLCPNSPKDGLCDVFFLRVLARLAR